MNPLPPETLRRLRPHVIDLNQGLLSTTGEFQSSEADVDAIFEDHLTAWARTQQGKPLRIVFYAHGGLTSEQAGLLTADEQVQWWLANEAYPIHFVWETGLMETFEQLLNPRRTQRGIDWAAPTDFALELLARGIGGVKVWAGMKVSAELASAKDGGARYAARKLKEFCEKPEFKDRIELHAIGHSAGSIFHAYFLPVALQLGVPEFKALHFLAPAIRVDTFEQQLFNKIGPGKGVEKLNVFTMTRDYELDDNCATVYQKSLLYLIYYALEPQRATPILGLEESIRGDAKLKRLFDLDRQGGSPGEIVWSVTSATTGPSASTSRSHGGFNNDAPTMQSVAHRIIGHAPTPFTGTEKRGLGIVEGLRAQEPSLAATLAPAGALAPASAAGRPAGNALTPLAVPGGRKRALCVGIDTYPISPLAGCANDARQWGQIFGQLGFESPQLLLNRDATRSAIIGALSKLLESSRPGDVIAFQFAGHGTQLPDLNGDEQDGDTPGLDEALCPVDFDTGRFLIDDDLGAIFDKIPDGVSVTVFADCCHSGSNTRELSMRSRRQPMAGDVRRRFIKATEEMVTAHENFRRGLPEDRSIESGKAYAKAREVLFAACRSTEVALESNGHGHFTTHATQLLASGVAGVTNASFSELVIHAFGEHTDQNPELHCATAFRTRLLLAPIAAEARTEPPLAATSVVASPDAWRGELARVLEGAAQALRS